MDTEMLGKLVELGLAGLILFIIIRPMITWLMQRADEKDQFIEKLVSEHQGLISGQMSTVVKQYEALDVAMKAMPTAISQAVMQSMTALYPPRTERRKRPRNR